MTSLGTNVLLGLCLALSAALAMAGDKDLSMTESQDRILADDRQLDNDSYDNAPGTLLSPHIKWAAGAKYQKLKALVVLANSSLREVVELRERFPMDIMTIPISSQLCWSKPGGYAEASPDLLERNAMIRLNRPEPYDVIIIGRVMWSAIPENYRNMILDKVSTGAGLVFVSPLGLEGRLKEIFEGAPDAVLELGAGVPLAMLPLEGHVKGKNAFDSRDHGPLRVKKGQLGQGRVLFLDYQDTVGIVRDAKFVESLTRYQLSPSTFALTPLVADDKLFYDYYYSLLGKGLLWSARKEPDARIAVTGDGAELQRGGLPAAPVSFSLQSKEKLPDGLRWHYELRDRDNKVLERKDFPADAKPLAPQMPKLPYGLYVLDAWAMLDGEVVDWASAHFRVGGERLLSLTCEKDSVKKGDPIAGQARLSGAPAGGAALRVKLLDTHGRLLAERSLEPKDGAAAFSFVVEHPLTLGYLIRVETYDQDGALETLEQPVGMPDSTVDDYMFVLWGSALQNRTLDIAMRQVRRLGVDCYYLDVPFTPESVCRESAEIMARNNLRSQPYTEHVATGHWQKSMDEERKRYGEDALGRGRAFSRYGTVMYSICEENVCTRDNQDYENPVSLAEYRQYMKDKFGSVEKLNQAWNSSYKAWDELGMISLSQAKLEKRFPQYVSQELYKQDRFMTIHEFVAAQIAKGDPNASVSIDIAVGNDFDWGRFAKLIRGGWAIPEMIPFLMYRPNTVYGEGIGYNERMLDEFRMRYYPWETLLRGGKMIFWWPLGFYGGLGGTYALTPDCSRPMLCFAQTSQEVAKIRHGVGKLLINSEKVKDPIMLLVSNVSSLADFKNNKETTWNASRTSFYTMLDRLGLTCRAISSEELAATRHGPGAKVLILPYCQAMSRPEVDAAKRFVADGGLLIADHNPAIFDELCRPYGQELLVSAGVEKVCPRCRGKGRYEEATETVTAWKTCPVCGGSGKFFEGREERYTGSPLEEVFGGFKPMALNTVGKGKAMYIGKTLSNPGDWAGFGLLLRQHASVTSPFKVENRAGVERMDVFKSMFRNGAANYLCFLGQKAVDPPDGEATLVMSEKRHVYDVLRQSYLGFTDKFQTGVVPAVPKIFAALPAKIQGLDLTVDKPVARPGAAVSVSATLAPPELKGCGLCMRFDLTGPDGKRIEHYSGKVVSNSGAFTWTVPLALNDVKGEYQVTVEEIASGLSKTVTFKVE